jgi:hypothetical protein
MGQQKFLPKPRATPQNSLDYGNLGKNLWLKKPTTGRKPKIKREWHNRLTCGDLLLSPLSFLLCIWNWRIP